tara:strand:- start:726 stop:1571 length:846 start_codon:yes stop_codon:yes gene_type:complete
MRSKYLSPAAYIRKLRLTAAKIVLNCGVPISTSTLVDGHKIRFLTTSFVEYFLRAEESYTREKVTMDWIRNYVKPDDIVYDVGANVGAYSLLIGKMVSQGAGKVYAFEPGAANFHSLSRNIEANGLSSNVIIFPIAFGDRRRITKFYLTQTTPGMARHAIDKPESDRESFIPSFIQGVPVDSLDEFIDETGIDFPNHIKIDVDGVETKIVGSMHNVLADSRLRTVLIEIESILSNGFIEETMAQAGFTEMGREQWGNRSIFNVLYVRDPMKRRDDAGEKPV